MAADLLITVATTLVILLIWYIAEMPEWKRQALTRLLMARIRKPPGELLSPKNLMAIAEFRVEISKYSHGGSPDAS
jgi:hypothetical protein